MVVLDNLAQPDISEATGHEGGLLGLQVDISQVAQVLDVFIIAYVYWLGLSVQRMDTVVITHPFINFFSLDFTGFSVEMEPFPVSTAHVFIFLVLNKVVNLLPVDMVFILQDHIFELLLIFF